MAEPHTPQTPIDPAVYQPHVNTAFVLTAAPEPLVLRLAAVDDRGVRSGVRQFSLFFHGPSTRYLPQGTYVLQHDALGPLLLFIVPVQGSNQERIVYEACFNVRADAP